MGEYADDIIEGRACSWCGVYFQHEHGYAVACHSCWRQHKHDTLENDEQIHGATGVQKAIHFEL